MTYEQADQLLKQYWEDYPLGDLIPLITAIRVRDYRLEREGK
jgi:hypothetical protein